MERGPSRAMESRPLGDTGLVVGALTFGSAPLATIFWENDEATAVGAVRAAHRAGIRLVDTAPFYGLGEAESRVGVALTGVGADEVIVATKVGRAIVDGSDGRSVEFDFSADAVRTQIESSLERLGRDRVAIAHVHDPEDHLERALHECVPALATLRAEGTVQAVSVGTNVCDTALRFLREADLDVIMLAGRLTLLDRSALDDVVPQCEARGVPLLAAAVFNSGVLADPEPGRWYDYSPADPTILERARVVHCVCADVGVSARAAAMAFPLRFPAVASVVVGMASAAEVEDNVAAFETTIPDELWERLEEAS